MNILPFPTQLTAPVQQQGRPGRHPKGVVSLRKVRFERYCATLVAKRNRQQEDKLLDYMERCMAEMYRLRGLLPGGPSQAT